MERAKSTRWARPFEANVVYCRSMARVRVPGAGVTFLKPRRIRSLATNRSIGHRVEVIANAVEHLAPLCEYQLDSSAGDRSAPFVHVVIGECRSRLKVHAFLNGRPPRTAYSTRVEGEGPHAPTGCRGIAGKARDRSPPGPRAAARWATDEVAPGSCGVTEMRGGGNRSVAWVRRGVDDRTSASSRVPRPLRRTRRAS